MARTSVRIDSMIAGVVMPRSMINIGMGPDVVVVKNMARIGRVAVVEMNAI